MRGKIVAGNIYHVLSRGVDKRVIFLDDGDYFRFTHDLFEFNDANPPRNNTYHFRTQPNNAVHPHIPIERTPRKLLVELLAFALMPNHYHLLMRPKTDDGVQRFMRKLNVGYAKYFNEKYKRSGALFEGRFKSIAVTREAHFIHLPYYIHFNPLDLATPEWRDRKMRDAKKAMQFLENYRWSSFQDYIGKKNFPSVTQREFLITYLGGPEEQKKATTQWLRDLEVHRVKDVALE